MANLITIENGVAILDPQTSESIAEYERAMKVLKIKEEELKNRILLEMEENNIIGIDDELNGLKITYVAKYDREVFDSKRFKRDNPDEYDKYINFTTVKSGIRIKVKD